jgi:hypothetical protein
MVSPALQRSRQFRQAAGLAAIRRRERAWLAAGRDVELHLFQSGGHGFGMQRQHTTSDYWMDEYLWWLETRGLLAP